MGSEARCVAVLGRRRFEGTALLESTELRFRGAERMTIPFATIESATARDGLLRLRAGGRIVAFELGPQAAKWLEKIRRPKSVIDKLGIKPGQVVSVLGMNDAGFLRDVRARAQVVTGRVKKDSNLVFLKCDSVADLKRLAAVRNAMARDGGIWVVWPKAQSHIKEDHARAAGKAAGLTDIKVVAFSGTHSALKLVIPVAKR